MPTDPDAHRFTHPVLDAYADAVCDAIANYRASLTDAERFLYDAAADAERYVILYGESTLWRWFHRSRGSGTVDDCRSVERTQDGC